MICYGNNGQSMRIVDNYYKATEGEVLFSEMPTPEQLSASFSGYKTALKHIAKLELDAEYETYYTNINKALAAATSLDNATAIANIKAKKVLLLAAHKAAKEAIDNG